jgi:hypothetical protein
VVADGERRGLSEFEKICTVESGTSLATDVEK